MANIVFSKGSGLQDSVYGKLLDPLRMVIEDRGEAYEQESILPLLYNMEKSTQYGETITGMTSMQGPQPVGEGGDYPYDSYREGYRSFVEHMTYKDMFEITREMVDDNKILQIKSRPAAFVKAWGRAREIHGIRMFGEAMQGNSSFTVANQVFPCVTADKLPLFSTAHTSITGEYGTQSNLFADAFSPDALAALEAKMQNFRDDNGVVQDVSPTTIVIPNDWALKKAVFAAIGADKDPETANNGFNFLFGRWNVVISQYLLDYVPAGDKPWILIDGNYNETAIGAVWYDREPLSIEAVKAPNDNLQHKGRARWGAGFHDWRFAAVGGVTGGDTLVS